MSSKEYRLVVFGLSTHELRVLRTISILSRNRPRTYVLDNSPAPDAADFAVVDGDDPQSLRDWQVFQATYPMVPAVMVGRAPTSKSSEYRINRPIMATRLLGQLDRMELSQENPAFVAAPANDAQPRQPTPLPPAEQPLPDSADAAGPRALVVDDSLPIRRQIKLELQRLEGGMNVDFAEDGKRAIELLATNSYDIVFLDVVLPGMDGYEICRTIKHDKGTKHTPVIMLTGKSSPFSRIKGKLAGCDTYLTKPVNRKKFDKAVETFLKQGERQQPMGGYRPTRAGPVLTSPIQSGATGN